MIKEDVQGHDHLWHYKLCSAHMEEVLIGLLSEEMNMATWVQIQNEGVCISYIYWPCVIFCLSGGVGKYDNIRMLQAALNKSWKQHLTKQWLYSHLLPKPSKEDEQDLLGKLIWHSPRDSNTCKHLCRLTNKNLNSSSLSVQTLDAI